MVMIICIRLNDLFFKFSKILGFGVRISLFGEFVPKYIINQKMRFRKDIGVVYAILKG